VRTLSLLLLILSVCAASCSKPTAAPPGNDPTATAPKAEVKATAPAPPPKIVCDTLVPEAVRAKFFPGATMKQEPLCPSCPEQCKLTKAGELAPAVVMADCRGGERPNWLERTKAAWEKGKTTKVDGIGRAAYKLSAMQLLFVPEGHNCNITITWLGGGDKLVEVAKAINSSLTPAALGK
jgi:hypothetical protein